jgi:hypothetical protein
MAIAVDIRSNVTPRIILRVTGSKNQASLVVRKNVMNLMLIFSIRKLFSFYYKKIKIFKTFLHELTHCFEEEYKIKISHKAVYKLEEAMFDFLVNNF